MKLINLLVQELPKRGGWPEGAVECERFLNEATIDFYDESGNWPVDCGKKYGAIALKCIKPREAGDGYRKENVKKEQYEAALAASKQGGWNGDGLPPVGCECEFRPHDNSDWLYGKVNYLSQHTIVIGLGRTNDVGIAEVVKHPRTLQFRPIRSEPERKRENTVDLIMGWMHHAGRTEIEFIYDAIAAGKIPGIRLE